MNGEWELNSGFLFSQLPSHLSLAFFFSLSSQILSIVFDGCGMCYHCENGFFFLP